MNDHNVYQTNNSETQETPEQAQQEREKEMQDDEESCINFLKPGHDQYVYRHANGLCVIGLAPTHVAFKDEGGITAVDFNVGKSDRSGFKVTGKRKKNAQHFESNTAVCKVCTNNDSYIVRCCVKGSLLEVNNRLIKQPGLLNSSADREGYIAIIMPKPADWLKIKSSLLGLEDYKRKREEC
ncbi:hypothetical protein CUMW_070180 [Citrus unshiu]|nr:hypothetical protein CUMW_070180 [Citrus unshiu]